jgi:hypothetical protein
MLGEAMLKTRRRRLDRLNETAVQRLAQIEASIAALPDEDLLDLADIYKDKPHTPLGEIASAEMARRSISL